MPTWLDLVVAVVAGLLLVWVAVLVTLALLLRATPDANLLRQGIRMLPDLVRLVSRLARDGSLPRGVRVRLWLLAGYLAMPVDVVPDVVPVLGFLDDAVMVALVLRSVVRVAGPGAIERHWPGTPQGLAVVRRLAGLPA